MDRHQLVADPHARTGRCSPRRACATPAWSTSSTVAATACRYSGVKQNWLQSTSPSLPAPVASVPVSTAPSPAPVIARSATPPSATSGSSWSITSGRRAYSRLQRCDVRTVGQHPPARAHAPTGRRSASSTASRSSHGSPTPARPASRGPARCCRADGRCDRPCHLSPVCAMPAMMCRWSTRKIRITGRIDSTDIASTRLNGTTSCPANRASATGSVYGLVLRDDQRPEEVVPAPDHGEDRDHGQRRAAQRQDDAEEDPELAGPVDPRCLDQVVGQSQHVLAQQEHPGRRRAGGMIIPHSEFTSPSDDHLVHRQEDHLQRDHDRGQRDEEERVAAAEVVLGQRVGRHRVDCQRQQCGARP